MKYEEIRSYAPVNDTDPAKVTAIAESLLRNGWQGAPILVASATGILITGSHRLAALKAAAEDEYVEDWEVAEDVQDIIDAWCEDNDCTIDDIDFADLGRVFAGTWVEEYKDDIEEW